MAGRKYNVMEARWVLHYLIIFANEVGEPKEQDLQDLSFVNIFEMGMVPILCLLLYVVGNVLRDCYIFNCITLILVHKSQLERL